MKHVLTALALGATSLTSAQPHGTMSDTLHRNFQPVASMTPGIGQQVNDTTTALYEHGLQANHEKHEMPDLNAIDALVFHTETVVRGFARFYTDHMKDGILSIEHIQQLNKHFGLSAELGGVVEQVYNDTLYHPAEFEKTLEARVGAHFHTMIADHRDAIAAVIGQYEYIPNNLEHGSASVGATVGINYHAEKAFAGLHFNRYTDDISNLQVFGQYAVRPSLVVGGKASYGTDGHHFADIQLNGSAFVAKRISDIHGLEVRLKGFVGKNYGHSYGGVGVQLGLGK